MIHWKIPHERNGKTYLKSMPVTLSLFKNKVKIESPYDLDLINEIKTLEQPNWEPNLKCWVVPLTEHNQARFKKLKGAKEELPLARTGRYCRKLYDHQKEGVDFVLSRHSAMLAFEMGLGKTLTAIEAIEQTVREGIVRWWLVAPKGAQKEWKRQLKNWDARFSFEVVTTYESLHKPMESYPFPPQGVVFDESIKIKNPITKRSELASELTRLIRDRYPVHYILVLSGPPAPKDPTEWWDHLHCIQPGYNGEGNIL